MTVAIPTINGQSIAMRFRDMTEFTLINIEDGAFRSFSEKKITLPHHHSSANHSHEGEGHHRRRQEILETLRQCDELWYRSLCKNWRNRLSDHTLVTKRINAGNLQELGVKLNS